MLCNNCWPKYIRETIIIHIPLSSLLPGHFMLFLSKLLFILINKDYVMIMITMWLILVSFLSKWKWKNERRNVPKRSCATCTRPTFLFFTYGILNTWTSDKTFLPQMNRISFWRSKWLLQSIKKDQRRNFSPTENAPSRWTEFWGELVNNNLMFEQFLLNAFKQKPLSAVN